MGNRNDTFVGQDANPEAIDEELRDVVMKLESLRQGIAILADCRGRDAALRENALKRVHCICFEADQACKALGTDITTMTSMGWSQAL
jgi:hypothetical protein